MAAQTSAAELAEPPKLCALCPRLVDFRERNRAKAPDWYNGAVPSFGDPAARVLIVGLAPGLNGANRTGRPFTGDYAGELLYGTLLRVRLCPRCSTRREPTTGFSSSTA